MSMVCWIKRLILCFVLVNVFHVAEANDYATIVKQAEMMLKNEEYVLTADLYYHLSEQAIEALQNGVPLRWTIKIKVKKTRRFWFDKTEVKHRISYHLQYHALVKMYRVRNEQTGAVNNFSTLTAALDDMATIRNFPLIDTKLLQPNSDYCVAIKAVFEESELPLPLQTKIIVNPQWQLSGDWTEWKLKP
jgi:Domain of unknown function (DUF4390)